MSYNHSYKCVCVVAHTRSNVLDEHPLTDLKQPHFNNWHIYKHHPQQKVFSANIG